MRPFLAAILAAVVFLMAFSFGAVQAQTCVDPPNNQGHDATRQLAHGLAATIPPLPHVLLLRDKQKQQLTPRVTPSHLNLRAAILIASGTVKNWGTQRIQPSDIATVGRGCGKAKPA
jgi:hypothetical protein